MAADDGGHDGGVCDPQAFDAADSELWVDDAGVVATHSAGADLVVDAVGAGVEGSFEGGFVKGGGPEWSGDGADDVFQGGGLGDSGCDAQAGHEGCAVGSAFVGEIAGVDDWCVRGIGGAQGDGSATVWPQQDGSEGDGVAGVGLADALTVRYLWIALFASASAQGWGSQMYSSRRPAV